MERSVIAVYGAFLNREAGGEERLITTGNALMCGEKVIAEWREDMIVLPRIDAPTKKMTRNRNGITTLAKQRGIRVVEER